MKVLLLLFYLSLRCAGHTGYTINGCGLLTIHSRATLVYIYYVTLLFSVFQFLIQCIDVTNRCFF